VKASKCRGNESSEEIDRNIPPRELRYHINEAGFAGEVVAEFKKMIADCRSSVAPP